MYRYNRNNSSGGKKQIILSIKQRWYFLEILGHVGMSKDWTLKKREVVKFAYIEMKSQVKWKLDQQCVEEVFSLMATIQTSAINSQRRDKLIWRHSRDESFSVKAWYLQKSSKKTLIDG